MLSAKEAKADAIQVNEDNVTPVMLSFESWVVEQASRGYFSGQIPAVDYDLSPKNLGYLDKLGYKIVLDADSRMWKVSW